MIYGKVMKASTLLFYDPSLQLFAHSQTRPYNKTIITFKRVGSSKHILLSLYNLTSNKSRVYIYVYLKLMLSLHVKLPSIFESSFFFLWFIKS